MTKGENSGGNGKLTSESKLTIGMVRIAIAVGLSFGITIASATAVILNERGRVTTLERDNEDLRIRLAGKMDLRDFQGWVREFARNPSAIPEAPR